MCICVCVCAAFVFIYNTDGYVIRVSIHVAAHVCVSPCACLSVLNCTGPSSLGLWQVTGVSVSPGKDQLVVFHTKDNRDLVVCLQGMVPANESRIGELVGTLLSHFKR